MNFKKALAGLTAFMCICTAMPSEIISETVNFFSVYAADIVDSGSCGENVNWELDSEGTLRIFGSGDMYEYAVGIDYGDSPFFNNNDVKNVIIEEGVTNISKGAFYCCNTLESIIISDSVTTIGACAFYSCSSLTSLVIPNNVKTIGHTAFFGCGSLTSVTVPTGITIIKETTFWGCHSLTSITIPDSITTIEYGAFAFCKSLTDVQYTGSEEQWSQILIEKDNDGLSSATIHYNNDNKCIWYLEPTIEADDIIVSDDSFDVTKMGDDNKGSNKCSFIERNGKYNFISYDGNIELDKWYSESRIAESGELSISDADSHSYVYCSSCISESSTALNRGALADVYYVYAYDKNTSEIYHPVQIGTPQHWGYECDSKCDYETAILIQEADINTQTDYSRADIDYKGKYGAAYDNNVTVAPIYDDGIMNVYNDMIALKSGNKWGYFNGKTGEQVIDFIANESELKYYCQSSWALDYTGMRPYTYSDGYVAVHSNDGWALYDATGNIIINYGTFEEIRPVHNGLAWVKDKETSLWGVLDIEKTVDNLAGNSEENPEIDADTLLKEKEEELLKSSITTDSILTSKGTDVYNFIGDELKTVRTFMADIDNSGEKELFAVLCSDDTSVIKKYWVENGKIIETEIGNLPKIEYCDVIDAVLFYNEKLEKYCISYSSYGAGAYTGTGYFDINLYTLEDNSINLLNEWYWDKQLMGFDRLESIENELIENNIPYMNVPYISFDSLSNCRSYIWLMHTEIEITDGSVPTDYTRYIKFDSAEELEAKSDFLNTFDNVTNITTTTQTTAIQTTVTTTTTVTSSSIESDDNIEYQQEFIDKALDYIGSDSYNSLIKDGFDYDSALLNQFTTFEKTKKLLSNDATHILINVFDNVGMLFGDSIDKENTGYDYLFNQMMLNNDTYKGFQDAFELNACEEILNQFEDIIEYASDFLEEFGISEEDVIKAIKNFELAIDSGDRNKILATKSECYDIISKNMSTEDMLELFKKTGHIVDTIDMVVSQVDVATDVFEYIICAEAYKNTCKEFEEVLLIVADYIDSGLYNGDIATQEELIALSSSIRNYVSAMKNYSEKKYRSVILKFVDSESELFKVEFVDEFDEFWIGTVCEALGINAEYLAFKIGYKCLNMVLEQVLSMEQMKKSGEIIHGYEVISSVLYGAITNEKFEDSIQKRLVDDSSYKNALLFNEAVKMKKTAQLLSIDSAIDYYVSRTKKEFNIVNRSDVMRYNNEMSIKALQMEKGIFGITQIPENYKTLGEMLQQNISNAAIIMCPVNVTIKSVDGSIVAFLSNEIVETTDMYRYICDTYESDRDTKVILFAEDDEVIISGEDEGEMNIIILGNNDKYYEFIEIPVTNSMKVHISELNDDNVVLDYTSDTLETTFICKTSVPENTTTTTTTSITSTTEPINKITLGDVNEDGSVNAVDASLVLAEYSVLSTIGAGNFSELQKAAGDINSDGMTDASDASAILAFYSYLSTDGTETDISKWLLL